MNPILRSLSVFFLLTLGVCSNAKVIYVKWDSPYNGPGNDWAHAYRTVTDGLNAAMTGDEVRVSGSPSHPYFERITLRPGVILCGGYEGNGDTRDIKVYQTILDGNRGGSVVTVFPGATASTLIDGFTLRNGFNNVGGGIICTNTSPTISNNTIINNQAIYSGGAGIYCDSSSSPIISNNTITGNTGAGITCYTSLTITGNTISGNREDGIACSTGSPTITSNTIVDNARETRTYGIKCINGSAYISDNVISSNTGGGLFCEYSSPVIERNRFVGNLGTAIFSNYSTPQIRSNFIIGTGYEGICCYTEREGNPPTSITNNTIVGNATGILCRNNSSPLITNNIVAYNAIGISGDVMFGKPILSHNCVYGSKESDYNKLAPGNTDLSISPELVSAEYGRVSLQPNSPCIDAGLNTAVQESWQDIDGQGRIQGNQVDIGADESDGTTHSFAPVIMHVSPSGGDSNDGLSWNTAKKSIQAAIDTVTLQGGEVWVAAGSYYGYVNLKLYCYVYGGFSGNETSRSERNWISNRTILSSSIGGSVVTAQTGDHLSTIDGFMILDGKDGIYCKTASPIIANNYITGTAGNGVFCYYSSPTIVGNTITANGERGIYCYYSSATISNNTIVGNSWYPINGGIHCHYSTPIISNNIIALNSSGVSVYVHSNDRPVLRSNCIYGNREGDYIGSTPGTGDINEDPKLVTPYYGRVHIQPDSPCIDVGDDAAVLQYSLDIDMEPRIQGAHVDIGSDESSGVHWNDVSKVVRVSPSGSDENDGSSWALAKRTMKSAVDALVPVGGEVWVAAGIYNETVRLRPYTYLYGGFTGNETSRTSRNPSRNVTVVDAGGKGSVIYAVGGDHVSLVDGFVLRNGFGNGGGVQLTCSSPTVSNNVITGNAGSPAAIYFSNSAATIGNNLITANGGKGIEVRSSTGATITGNTIVGNSSADDGGGIYCLSSSSLIANNIVAFNSSGIYGGGKLQNNCVYSNAKYNYGYGLGPGLGDISSDPKLVSISLGRMHLQPDSPCIDSGINAAVLAGSTDIDGQERIQGNHVDIGADESDGTLWDAAPTIIHVHPSGNDANDGLSWNKPKKHIQAAIDTIRMLGGEAWVAHGTYEECVTIPPYTYLFGGFAGTESDRNQRSWKTNQTIIDGSGNGSVVTARGGIRVSTIDGFTIRNGSSLNGGGINCDRSSIIITNNDIIENTSSYGGAIYCAYESPEISGNLITQNTGTDGGIIFCSGASTPKITRNRILENNGTGVYCWFNSSPTVWSNIIAKNNAQHGGGLYIYESSNAVISSNAIVGNNAQSGGGICSIRCSPKISNNIVAYNSSGICVDMGAPQLRNNCFYGNSAYNYSGISAGTGDITQAPGFIDFAGGDYHLTPGSACINAGWNFAPFVPEVDIDGENRIMGGALDIGADEFTFVADMHSAKLVPDGTGVYQLSGIVTATFDGFFYIEFADRSAGIRVDKPSHGLTRGKKVYVTGFVTTNSDGERVVEATSVLSVGEGLVTPLMMNIRSLGGGSIGYQDGVWSYGWHTVSGGHRQLSWFKSEGLNNIGLLVKICGKVTQVDPAGNYLYIDDGSALSDLTLTGGNVNIGVRVAADGRLIPLGQLVTVTGMSSCLKLEDGRLIRLLRVTGPDSIQVIPK